MLALKGKALFIGALPFGFSLLFLDRSAVGLRLTSRIVDYDVKDVLGKGAFGEVNKVVRKTDGREFAHKKILVTDGKENAIETEGEAMRRVRGRQTVINLQAVFRGDGGQITGFVMNLLPGGSLDDNIGTIRNSMGQELRVRFLKKVLHDGIDGLAYMSKRGVVSADVKGGNMGLSKVLNLIDLNAQISDMDRWNAFPVVVHFDLGLAEMKDWEKGQKSLRGTTPFLSPEVVKAAMNGLPFAPTFESDLWALGVAVFILLEGKFVPWIKRDEQKSPSAQRVADILGIDRYDGNISFSGDAGSPDLLIVRQAVAQLLDLDPAKRKDVQPLLTRLAPTGFDANREYSVSRFQPKTRRELDMALDVCCPDPKGPNGGKYLKDVCERSDYGPIESWDVSLITDMRDLFEERRQFNADIGDWNTAAVTNMHGMFFLAENFNQPLGKWKTGNVKDMSWMFGCAANFNHSIGAWNTANVTNMRAMFKGARSFNQPIGGWDTKSVKSMEKMFSEAASFNQPIGKWNTGAVTTATDMFGEPTHPSRAVAFERTFRAAPEAQKAPMIPAALRAKVWGSPMDINVRGPAGTHELSPVHERDGVHHVKAEIEKQFKGWPADQQKLFFEGQQLEDGKTLAEYGIEDGAGLALAPKKILIKTLDGQAWTVPILDGSGRPRTCQDIKKYIAAELESNNIMHVDWSKLTLLLFGMPLADDETLFDRGCVFEEFLYVLGVPAKQKQAAHRL